MNFERDRRFWGSGSVYHALLALLLLQMILAPVRAGGGVALRLTFAAVLVACIVVVASNRRLLLFGIALGGPALVLSFTSGGLMGTAGILFGIGTMLFICFVLLRRIIDHPVVTSGTISAALVVYLLLGVIWFQAFVLVEHLAPGSFYGISTGDPAVIRGELFYYSFVTLTTLGYGDIGPLSDQSRALALTEAIIGQLYLVVLVAALVGMHLTQRVQVPETD